MVQGKYVRRKFAISHVIDKCDTAYSLQMLQADRVHYFLMRDMLRDFVESLVIDLDAVILKSENEILIYIVVFILAALLSLLVSIL